MCFTLPFQATLLLHASKFRCPKHRRICHKIVIEQVQLVLVHHHKKLWLCSQANNNPILTNPLEVLFCIFVLTNPIEVCIVWQGNVESRGMTSTNFGTAIGTSFRYKEGISFQKLVKGDSLQPNFFSIFTIRFI
jgi:hypothetical protein